jgi:hypothetical protein
MGRPSGTFELGEWAGRSVLVGEHDRQNGLAVVAGATNSLELDRDGVGASGHQEEDLEEDGVGVAGLGLADGVAKNIQDVPQTASDRLALSDEAERWDDIGMVKRLGERHREYEASLTCKIRGVDQHTIGESLTATIYGYHFEAAERIVNIR